jgi:hypothetical protein
MTQASAMSAWLMVSPNQDVDLRRARPMLER